MDPARQVSPEVWDWRIGCQPGATTVDRFSPFGRCLGESAVRWRQQGERPVHDLAGSAPGQADPTAARRDARQRDPAQGTPVLADARPTEFANASVGNYNVGNESVGRGRGYSLVAGEDSC